MNYKHNEMAGRDFKPVGEGFSWFLLKSGGGSMYCKMNKENFEKALNKMSFEIWHPCVIQPVPQGGVNIVYLAVNTNTLEPWIMSEYSQIATVHPDPASELEKVAEESTRRVKVATMSDMPKETAHKPLIKV